MLFFLLIKLNVDTLALLSLYLFLRHLNDQIFLLATLIEKHVGRFAIGVSKATHIAGLSSSFLCAERRLLEVLKVPVRDAAVVKLHPWISLCLDPRRVALFLISATIRIDVGPVVAGIGCA